jgi:glycosidase
MLHFLDNHDEQRLASPEFAGTPEKGKPLMVISATLGSSPTMIYFGQEVGEAGAVDGGFGKPTRTSIFDYVGVPNHQRWMNGGKFDGGKLSDAEKQLRDFYSRLLNFTTKSSALMGSFADLQKANREATTGYDPGIYAFARWSKDQKLVVVANCSWVTESHFDMKVPTELITQWKLKDGTYPLKDQLYGKQTAELKVSGGVGTMHVNIQPSESFIFGF